MGLKSVLLATALCMAGCAAYGQSIPYPDSGTQNAAMYAFTASASGQIDAYFAAPSGAAYAEAVELIVNGVATGNFGLINKSTSPGTEFDMGSVLAGDTIGFALEVFPSGTYGEGGSYLVYSDPSLNLAANGGIDTAGNGQHLYSTPYAQSSGLLPSSIPSGIYAGFEDAAVPGSDLNYADETYVFTDVGVSTIPEPATLALLGLGLAGLTGLRRRRRQAA